MGIKPRSYQARYTTGDVQATLRGLKPSPEHNSQASPVRGLDVSLLVPVVLQQLGAAEQHVCLVALDG